MNIIYTTQNNNCFNNTIGSISIDQIIFDNAQEANQYQTYTIIWDGNIIPTQISTNGRIASDLANGQYSFKIVSTSSNNESILYTTTITSPEPLNINHVSNSEYSCGNNGKLSIYVSGGQPPYTYYAGTISEQSEASSYTFSTLPANDYEISVVDANNCRALYTNTVSIDSGEISYVINNISSPKIYDGPVDISLNITGPGPFDLIFQSTTDIDNKILIGSYETEYIQSISEDNKTYSYLIKEKLSPGSYNIIITNSSDCTISNTIFIPNISPTRVNANIRSNANRSVYNLRYALPIFDTVLIPYKHILENSTLWQAIKQYNLKDEIKIKIDDTIYSYKIVRNILNKYCIDDSKIEILKLGNTYKDWFFYFYIAPSINLTNNTSVLNSQIKLIHNNLEFDIKLGLDNNSLNIEDASLIRGSFILNNLGYNEFIDGGNAYVYFSDPDNMNDYSYVIKKIKKTTLKNIYAAGFTTAINFLEQFNVLNENVSINQTSCIIDKETYEYIIQLKKFLIDFNNINNAFNVEIANIDSIRYSGSLSININGQNFFTDVSGNRINNSYSIEYFTFDEYSRNLQQFFLGNQLIKNTTNLSQLKDGFVIIRIKDLYNNQPKLISVNNGLLSSYDDHFIKAKQLIQKYNFIILNQFLYGDILVYVGNLPPDLGGIPSAPVTTPTVPATIITPRIRVTKDETNTSSINIKILPKNVKCWIYGPKNYHKSFNSDISFDNLIPGVYTIVGDNEYLQNNNLYYNEYRIFLKSGTIENISLEFISYNQSVFTKDIE